VSPAKGGLTGAQTPAAAATRRLFTASCMALTANAVGFVVRADILGELGRQFHLSQEQLGWIGGAAFWGFVPAILVGGWLCDLLGIGAVLAAAALVQAVGLVTTILAPGAGLLWAGTLLVGMGNGLVGAAVNPLVVTVYPEAKTSRLNAMHSAFPAGVVVGGLACFALSGLGGGWQVKVGMALLPIVIYGALFFGQPFPRTERVACGVSTGQMLRESVRPGALLWLGCMLLTSGAEISTNQWAPNILTRALPGLAAGSILVLAWINGLMGLGRYYAAPLVRRLSPTGLLALAAALAAAGLLGLGRVGSIPGAFGAATVYALGVGYFWPTMLGVASERFPKGGALLLAMMGAAGCTAGAIAMPLLGRIQDYYAHALLARGAASWEAALAAGGTVALQAVAVLPLVLVVIFGTLRWRERAAGGYQVVKLGAGREQPQ